MENFRLSRGWPVATVVINVQTWLNWVSDWLYWRLSGVVSDEMSVYLGFVRLRAVTSLLITLELGQVRCWEILSSILTSRYRDHDHNN